MKSVKMCESEFDEGTVFLATHSFSRAYRCIEHHVYEGENVTFSTEKNEFSSRDCSAMKMVGNHREGRFLLNLTCCY